MPCLGALGNERDYKSVLIYYNIYLPSAPAQHGPWHPPQGMLALLPSPPASPSFPELSMSTQHYSYSVLGETAAVFPFITTLSVPWCVSLSIHSRNEHPLLEGLCVNATKLKDNLGNGKEYSELWLCLFLQCDLKFCSTSMGHSEPPCQFAQHRWVFHVQLLSISS